MWNDDENIDYGETEKHTIDIINELLDEDIKDTLFKERVIQSFEHINTIRKIKPILFKYLLARIIDYKDLGLFKYMFNRIVTVITPEEIYITIARLTDRYNRPNTMTFYVLDTLLEPPYSYKLTEHNIYICINSILGNTQYEIDFKYIIRLKEFYYDRFKDIRIVLLIGGV